MDFFYIFVLLDIQVYYIAKHFYKEIIFFVVFPALFDIKLVK